MLFRHHIRSPLLNPRHFSPSTYFGIFCTAGALVVITVYRVSTSSITQSTSLTFCSKAHRACIKQRSNLTIPNNIFRHTCLSSVKQFIKCKQCKQFSRVLRGQPQSLMVSLKLEDWPSVKSCHTRPDHLFAKCCPGSLICRTGSLFWKLL